MKKNVPSDFPGRVHLLKTKPLKRQRIAVSPSPLLQEEQIKFISGADLMKRWKIARHELMARVTAKKDCPFRSFFCSKLIPYSRARREPYRSWNPVIREACKRANIKYEPPPLHVEHQGDIYDSLNEALFRITDIEAYEKATPIKKSNRISNQHKDAVRDMADKLWKQDPELTIETVISHDSVHGVLEGKSYNDKTLRNWIKDLSPNRKPGRRPAKK